MNAEAHAWIELSNVTKRYGRQTVLDGASVNIAFIGKRSYLALGLCIHHNESKGR